MRASTASLISALQFVIAQSGIDMKEGGSDDEAARVERREELTPTEEKSPLSGIKPELAIETIR